MKLYKVYCVGMTDRGVPRGVANGIAYVVAADAEEAYTSLRAFLDKEKLGDAVDRALSSVHLVAEMADYPTCGYRLLLNVV